MTEALDLDAFDESVMDAQIEYATVINNTVTFHFRDGHTVTKSRKDHVLPEQRGLQLGTAG